MYLVEKYSLYRLVDFYSTFLSTTLHFNIPYGLVSVIQAHITKLLYFIHQSHTATSVFRLYCAVIRVVAQKLHENSADLKFVVTE